MKVVEYLKDTRGELQNVNWPNRRQTIILTAVVIGLSFLTAFLLGFFDAIFGFILQFFI